MVSDTKAEPAAQREGPSSDVVCRALIQVIQTRVAGAAATGIMASKQSTASCYVLRQLTPALQCKWHSVPSSHETQCSVAELFSPEKPFCPCPFCPVCSLIQSQNTQQKPAVVEPQQVFFNSKNTTSHLLWLTNSAFSIIVT
jgi:hypothetical protein